LPADKTSFNHAAAGYADKPAEVGRLNSPSASLPALFDLGKISFTLAASGNLGFFGCQLGL
jgi:hypothetical protein